MIFLFCPKCGASLPNGAKFCGKCGTPISLKTGSSSIENQSVERTNTDTIEEPLPPVQDDKVICAAVSDENNKGKKKQIFQQLSEKAQNIADSVTSDENKQKAREAYQQASEQIKTFSHYDYAIVIAVVTTVVVCIGVCQVKCVRPLMSSYCYFICTSISGCLRTK